MDDIDKILWVILGISILSYWFIGKVYIFRPQYVRLVALWNPVRARIALLMPSLGGWLSAARILLLMPVLGMLGIIIGGFALTERGWWFLGAVVFIDIAFAPIFVPKE